jgi:hypothetical protein
MDEEAARERQKEIKNREAGRRRNEEKWRRRDEENILVERPTSRDEVAERQRGRENRETGNHED